jgi:ornithine cyclodeaminase
MIPPAAEGQPRPVHTTAFIGIDAARTRELLAFEPLVAALRRAFAAGCRVPPRHTHTVEVEEGKAGTVLIMPAWNGDGYLGIKTICIYPGNAALGLPGLHATYMLYDARTGVPLARIDGTELTTRRTAAASALAASYLARPDASMLAIVGTGRIASVLAQAYRVVRPIRCVRVWGRTASRAAELVARLRAEGFDADVAPDLEVAVHTADIVTCATLATEPLVHGRWLRPGVHLDLIGAFAPGMRESDDECFRGTRVFVDTYEAESKAGDLISPLRHGVLHESGIQGRLEELCRGVHPGRRQEHEITVFKSVGTALEDLAAAVLVYERALGSV